MSIISDHSGLKGIPEFTYLPKNTADLSLFLKSSPYRKFRIGAGLSGVSGGAVPVSDETYVSMLAFNELHWIDESAGILFAGAGVSMESLKKYVAESGWFFPVIPGSEQKATVGAMVACNGGGPFSLRYGKIENFVKGIEMVDVLGNIRNWGTFSKKVSEGPPFHKIMVGSEGTLGFITGVILQAVPPPASTTLMRIAHKDFFALLPLLPVLLKMNPLFLEMADREALQFSSKAEESVIWVGLEELPDLGQRTPFSVKVENMEGLQERFNIGKNLQAYKSFIDLDISFPLNQSMPILSGVKQILEEAEAEHIFFGHAGDGNWHVHIFYELQLNPEIKDAIDKIDRLLLKHKGHLSGEHGIGRIHHTRWAKMATDDWKWGYRLLKKQMDPEEKLPSMI
jgi:glycolate oxidase